MQASKFDGLIKSAEERMKLLYRQAGSPPTHQHGLVPETFEELQLALEELQVASEELRQQNEVLGDTQTQLAVERYRYTDLFQSAPEPYFVSDLKGIIVEANTAAAQMINVGSRYVVGKPLANYIPPVDRDRFRGYIETLLETSETHHWPLDMKPRHQESLVPVLLSASAIRNAENTVVGLRWIMRDAAIPQKIDEERAARAQADQERSQLAKMLNDISDPLFVVSEYWTVTIANKRCLEAWEMDGGEALGASLWELFPNLPKSEVGRRLQESAAEQTQMHFQGASFANPNQWVEMHVHPVTSGLAVYFRDVTERREREEQAEIMHTRDRTISETLQRSLLVKPHREDLPGLEIGMVYQAAWKDALVGGDYYDAFKLQNEPKIVMVIGDVTGKGLKAASYTAQMKYALRAFFWEDRSPGAAMARLNDYMCSQQTSSEGEELYGRLVALTIAVVNTESGEIAMTSAGGSPALLIRNESDIQICEADGMLIGVMPGEVYEETIYRLEIGDSLLLTTDGILDCRNAAGEFLGIEGLIGFAGDLADGLSVQEQAASVLEQVRIYSNAQLQDDVCLLMARRAV